MVNMSDDLVDRNAARMWQAGVFRYNPEFPYFYRSCKFGPTYFDLSEIQEFPELWTEASKDFATYIRSVVDVDRVTRVSGGAVRDLIFSMDVARLLGKPHVIIRKEETGHGTGGRLITKIKPEDYVLHVADLRTEGTSEKDWMKVIRESGGVVEHSVVFFDRLQGGAQAVRDAGAEPHAFLEMNDRFLEGGVSAGRVTPADVRDIKAYQSDTLGWHKRFEAAHPNYLEHYLETRAAHP
jgi:orotate phosphoribosyltransferase